MNNLKENIKNIKIAGTGLSGLTAAINLAKAGYNVEVYERFSEIGGKIKENAQMLPNWFSGENIIEELEKCNIKIYPLNKVTKIGIYFEDRKFFTVIGAEDDPVGYTVLRGGNSSFEKDLADQARKLGVKIITNFEYDIDNIEPDIIATGTRIEKSEDYWAAGYGRVYRGQFNPRVAKVFFTFRGEKLAYNYLYPHGRDKVSVVVCGVRPNITELKNSFFKDKFLPPIPEIDFLYEFIGFICVRKPRTRIEESLVVGEAAGFQALFGFGMRHAILSGFLAAKAIIENLDYDILWKSAFIEELKKFARLRNFLNGLSGDFKLGQVTNLINKEREIKIEKIRRLFLSKRFNLILLFLPFFKGFFKNKHLIKYFLKKL